MSTTYAKILTANDTGETRSHQVGICVPKGDDKLLSFFPPLDITIHNPDAWISCIDDSRKIWKMRYVYYNGKLLGKSTRNEYRIAHITNFLKTWRAQSGDQLLFTETSQKWHYRVSVESPFKTAKVQEEPDPTFIKLRGWHRIY